MCQIILALTSQKQNQKLEKVFSTLGYDVMSAYDLKAVGKTIKESNGGLIIACTQTPFLEKILAGPFKKHAFWNMMILGDKQQAECYFSVHDKQCYYLSLPCKGRDVVKKAQEVIKTKIEVLSKDMGESNCGQKKIAWKGRPIDMTAQETALFEVFLETPGQVLSREELFQKAWGSQNVGNSRTVDVHVQRLRSKLGDTGIIETVYNQGYRLSVF